MVDTGSFGEVGSQLVGTLTSGILVFGIVAIVIIAVSTMVWYLVFHKKKFDIIVKCISERAGDRNVVILDKAAYLTDRKSKTRYFRIWGMKIDLTAPKFNVLQNAGKSDYLEIYRKADNEFYFLRPVVVSKTQIIKSDGKKYGIAQQESIPMDTDIQFWATKRKSMNKKMFDTESMLMKLLPYIPAIMVGIISIFVLYVLLDHLPEVLAALTKLTSELKGLKQADIVTSLFLLTWKTKH